MSWSWWKKESQIQSKWIYVSRLISYQIKGPKIHPVSTDLMELELDQNLVQSEEKKA